MPESVIADALRQLATPTDNLHPDPDNARRGDSAAIRRSLNAFGQRKPIVVRRTGHDAQGRPTGIVVAGNHTFAAACDLGWTEVAAVFVDDDAATARAYALADNRTGELATWDADILARHIGELEADKFDLTVLGWSETELGKLLGEPSDLTSFKAYDDEGDDASGKATTATCPECGHEFTP